MYVLDKLWQEGLYPCEMPMNRDNHYRNVLSKLSDLNGQLMAEMTDQGKEVFEDYSAARAELDHMEQQEVFIEAFRLGAEIILDILGSRSAS